MNVFAGSREEWGRLVASNFNHRSAPASATASAAASSPAQPVLVAQPAILTASAKEAEAPPPTQINAPIVNAPIVNAPIVEANR